MSKSWSFYKGWGHLLNTTQWVVLEVDDGRVALVIIAKKKEA